MITYSSNTGSRKLACSKDDGGCARCRRENIACHYSEQKVMGRPRKRQFIESTEPATTLDTDPLELGPVPSIVDNADSYSDPVEALFMNGNTQLQYPSVVDPQLHSKHGIPYSRWQFGGSMNGPPVNYGVNNAPSDGSPGSTDTAPQLSNASSSDSASSPQITGTLVPCGCLASSMC